MKRIVKSAVLMLASVSLTACSMFNFGTTAPSEEEQNAPINESEIVEAATSYEITAGITDFDSYDPLTTRSDTVKDVCGFVFEPLFELDANMCTIHVLAESYEVSADGKMITIKLKPGVLWHDETPFTAADVVYTANMIKRGGTRYDGWLDDVTGIQAAGNDTVVAYFRRSLPDPALLFSFPIIKNGSANYGFNAVGTGPFFFDASGNLTANENYYDGRAILDRINIKVLPDDDKYISLFDASVIDFATSDKLNMASYMPKSNSNVWDFISNDLIFVGFNTKSKVFSDVYARRAISYVIDRDSIVNRIYFTRAVPVYYAVNPSSWTAFDTNKRHNSDFSAAIEQLSAGGWKLNENGIYTRESAGKLIAFSVKILVNKDSDERVRIAEMLCDTMKNNGILASVDKCSASDFPERITAGNYDMFIGETEILPNGDLTMLAGSGSNSFGYSSSEVDNMISQLGTLDLDDDIKSVTRSLNEKLFEDAPYAPICFMKKSLVTSANLEYGITPSVSGFVRASKYWCNK